MGAIQGSMNSIQEGVGIIIAVLGVLCFIGMSVSPYIKEGIRTREVGDL